MSTMTLTEKHFEVKNIDRAWLERSLQTFQDNKAKGKMPYLWDRHNSRETPAQVIGRLDNLRIEDEWLYADVIITDEKHQQKFLAGKSPSKSVEYQPDNYYLRGLALLDGHEGHFDFEVPDFVPEGLYDELVALGLNPDAHTVLCNSTAPVAKTEINMNADELKTLLAENNRTLLAEVDKKLSGHKQTATTDVDAALQQVRDQERAAASVALAKVQREAKVTAYTAQLAAKTGTPEALVRKSLEKNQSDEALDIDFRAKMREASADVKLGIEREARSHADIADSYAEYKDNHPTTTVSLSEFARLCERADEPHASRFAGRKVSNAAFA